MSVAKLESNLNGLLIFLKMGLKELCWNSSQKYGFSEILKNHSILCYFIKRLYTALINQEVDNIAATCENQQPIYITWYELMQPYF